MAIYISLFFYVCGNQLLVTLNEQVEVGRVSEDSGA